jgi:hypothetical protein
VIAVGAIAARWAARDLQSTYFAVPCGAAKRRKYYHLIITA